MDQSLGTAMDRIQESLLRYPGTLVSASSPRPSHFIVRPNGVLVPLIAADELPPSVTIRGVPKEMARIQETVGMTNVGSYPRHGNHYTVEDLAPGGGLFNRPTSAGQVYLHRSPVQVAPPQTSPMPVHETPPPTASAPWLVNNYPQRGVQQHLPEQRNPERTQELIDAITAAAASAERRSKAKSTGPAGAEDKIYCTHWVYHGECAFIHGKGGCKYKHEMPTDPETMAQLCLRNLPKWWQEKQSLRSLEASWRPTPGSGGDGDAKFVLPPAPKGGPSTRPGHRAPRRESDGRGMHAASWKTPPKEADAEIMTAASNSALSATVSTPAPDVMRRALTPLPAPATSPLSSVTSTPRTLLAQDSSPISDSNSTPTSSRPVPNALPLSVAIPYTFVTPRTSEVNEKGDEETAVKKEQQQTPAPQMGDRQRRDLLGDQEQTWELPPAPRAQPAEQLPIGSGAPCGSRGRGIRGKGPVSQPEQSYSSRRNQFRTTRVPRAPRTASSVQDEVSSTGPSTSNPGTSGSGSGSATVGTTLSVVATAPVSMKPGSGQLLTTSAAAVAQTMVPSLSQDSNKSWESTATTSTNERQTASPEGGVPVEALADLRRPGRRARRSNSRIAAEQNAHAQRLAQQKLIHQQQVQVLNGNHSSPSDYLVELDEG